MQKITIKFHIIILLITLFKQVYNQTCSIVGCLDSQYQPLTSQCVCNSCSDQFTLTQDQQCRSTVCGENKQYYQLQSLSSNVQSAQCLSICPQNQIANDYTNICDISYMCTQTFIQNFQTNQGKNVQYVIFSPNDNLLYLVYDTFLNAIDSLKGTFIKTFSFDSGISTLNVIDNQLFLFNISSSQLLLWDQYLSQVQFYMKIIDGDIKSSSKIFRAIDSQKYLICTFDSAGTNIFVSLVQQSEQDSESLATIPVPSQFEMLLTFYNFIIIQRTNDFKIKLGYVTNTFNQPNLILSLDYFCDNIQGTIIDSFSNTQQEQYFFYMIFQNTTSIFTSFQVDGNYQCKSIPTLDNSFPLKMHSVSLDFCNNNTNIQLIIILLSSQKLVAYQILPNNYLEVFFQVIISNQIIDFKPVIKQNFLYLYSITQNSTVFIHKINSYLCQQQISLNIQQEQSFNIKLNPPFSIYSLQELVGQLNFQQVILTSYDIQVVIPSADQPFLFIRDFQDKIFANEKAISKIVYLENIGIIASCSIEGKLILWQAVDPLDPQYILSIKRPYPCLDIAQFGNSFIVAKFAFEVLITNSLNILQTKSYPILSATTYSLIASTSNYIYIFCDASALILSSYNTIVAKSQKALYPSQFANMQSIFVPQADLIVVQTKLSEILVYNFDVTTQIINGTYLSYYANKIPIYSIKIFNLDQQSFRIVLFDYLGFVKILDNQLNIVNAFRITLGAVLFIDKYMQYYIFTIYITNSTQINQFTLIIFDSQKNQQTQVGQLFVAGFFVQFKTKTNNLGQQTFVLTNAISAQNTAITVQVFWVPSLNILNAAFAHFTFSTQQTLLSAITDSQQSLILSGNLSGQVRVQPTPNNQLNEMQVVYSQNINTTDKIQFIQFSAQIGKYFIINSQVHCYSIYTDILLETLSLPSTIGNPTIQSIQGFYISEQHNLVIAFIQKELIIRNFNSNMVSYTINLTSELQYINGFYMDEAQYHIIIYGDKILKSSMDLNTRTVISGNDQTLTNFANCQFTQEIFACRVSSQRLVIYNKALLKQVSSILTNLNSFNIILDTANQFIIIFSSSIYSYSYKGTLLQSVNQISQNIKSITYCDSFFVAQTSSMAYMFNRLSFQQLSSFVAPGGTLYGMVYLPDIQQIGFYCSDIRSGQIIFLSTTNFQQNGYMVNTYDQVGLGQIVKAIYDQDSSMVNYFDSYGNSQNIITNSLGIDNTFSIEEIQQFQQPKPVDFIIDFITNTILVHNGIKTWKLNYNLHTRPSKQFISKPYKHYFQLNQSSQNNQNTAFLIADYYNTVYFYQNYQVTYFCQFSQEIIYMQTIQQQSKILYIIFYQFSILVFNNYQDMVQEQNALLILQQYSFKGLLLEDQTKLIINTIDNKIVDFDFFKNQEIFSTQLDLADVITAKLVTGSSNGPIWILLVGTQTGKIFSYNLMSQTFNSLSLKQQIQIQYLYQFSEGIFVSVDKNGGATMISTQDLVITQQQQFMDTINKQITQENGSLITKSIQLVKVDLTNQRFFVNFYAEKKVGVWNIQNFQFIQYLIFPDDQWKQIILSSDFIILYCSFQINIHDSQDYSYIAKARRYYRKDQITDLRLINQNILVSVFATRIEILLIDKTQNLVILQDTITLSNPFLIYSGINTLSNQLLLIGTSQNSVFEKRFSLSLLQNQLVSINKNQKRCYSQLLFSNQANLQNQYKNIYDPNNPNLHYSLQVLIYNEIRSMYSINQSQTSVVMRPQSSTNNQLNIRINSFNNINFDVQLQGFDFQFIEQGQQISSNTNSSRIILQDILIQQQNITDQTTLFFKDKNLVSLQNIQVQNVNITGGSSRILSSNSQDSAFIFIQNTNNVVIQNFIIDNLNFINFQGKFLIANQVTNLTINSLTIQNSQFDSIFQIFQVDYLEIYNLTISKCKSVNNNQNQNSYAFDLIGINTINLNLINIFENQNIFAFSTSNNFYQNGQIIYLQKDEIKFVNSSIYSNTFTFISNQQLNLLNLQSSIIQVDSLVFKYNKANILVKNSITVVFSNSQFFLNQGIKGGALQITKINNYLYILNSHFDKNIVQSSGGSIYLEDVNMLQIDSLSSINSSQAIIGGGIRIFNQNMATSLKYQILCQMKYNTAELYGDNIGDLLDSISIFYSDKVLQIGQKFEEIDLKLVYQGSIINSSNKASIQNIQSGGQINMFIQLIDNQGSQLKVNQTKYLNNLYSQDIKNELDSYLLEFNSEKSNLNNILDIKGQTIVSIKQYNFDLSMFQFTSLVVSSQPLYTQAQAMVLINYQLINYSSSISINLKFRACLQGEVLEYQSKNYVNQNNSISLIQMITCQECSYGTYSFIDPMTEYSQEALNQLKDNSYQAFQACKKCPQEAFQCQSNNITLQKGFWRSSNSSDEIIECNSFNPQICNEQDANSKDGCIEGYIGPLCESCDATGVIWNGKRYTQSMQNFQCQQCSSFETQITFLVISIIVLLIYLFVSTLFFMDRYIYHSTCYYSRFLKFLPFSNSCTMDQSTFFMKILINYIQISTLLYSQNINIAPQFLSIVPNTTGKPGSQIVVSSVCLYGSGGASNIGIERIRAYSMCIFPITLVIILFLVLTVLRFFKIWRVSYYHKYIMIIVAFLFFQPDTIGFFTKAISCRKIGTKSYQQINQLISCDDKQYKLFSLYFILPNLIFWLLSPSIILLIFRYKKGRDTKKLNYCTTKYMFGYFYLEYKTNYYYWEFIRIYFKIIFVLLSTLLSEVLTQITSFYLVLAFIYIIILIKVQPFENKFINRLEIFSYCITIPCIIFFSLYQTLQIDTFQYFTAVIHYTFMAYLILLILRIKLNTQKSTINMKLKKCFQSIFPEIVYKFFFKSKFQNNNSLRKWRFLYKNLKITLTQINQAQSQKKSFIAAAFNSLENNNFQSYNEFVLSQQAKNETEIKSPNKKLTLNTNRIESIPFTDCILEKSELNSIKKFNNKSTYCVTKRPQGDTSYLSRYCSDLDSTPSRSNNNLAKQISTNNLNIEDGICMINMNKNLNNAEKVEASKVIIPNEENDQQNYKIYDFNHVISKLNQPKQIESIILGNTQRNSIQDIKIQVLSGRQGNNNQTSQSIFFSQEEQEQNKVYTFNSILQVKSPVNKNSTVQSNKLQDSKQSSDKYS
ncbi:transmembrane protein, putative (macronuclear) [Tetrahymena thermophila SB210]|uniref:Transmembrane protein, putative n=1 Tax=Tetrahymena thermophila (strain SB210) TaxID=312017 RepID=Q23Q29_TETTS|nr:transmembrane protein, putative [Tetrahymena thermophila SB210]EAR98506.2 transmembrane protein, putative [Tetrahymena thermophila SB210]|eukprot:XP_001018751.2 transmembrane protein, putative [Tetrahymena thermophila SB210]